METGEPAPLLSERDVADIRLFCEIARVNGTHLSLKEALLLLQPEFEEPQLQRALENAGETFGELELTSGLITSKTEDLEEVYNAGFHDAERKLRAARNLNHARIFVAFNGGSWARAVSVSGSVSYGSASESDDVDFFCITRKDTLWLFLTKALILARVFQLLDRDSPVLCFSYLMDEGYARETFKTTRDELFARDALKATTIIGADYYNDLLRTNGWLSSPYPRLYRSRVRDNDGTQLHSLRKDSSPIIKASNSILYELVGRYLRLKAYLKNRRLTRDKLHSSLFRARLGVDHCIYESARYEELRRVYRHLNRTKEINGARTDPQ